LGTSDAFSTALQYRLPFECRNNELYSSARAQTEDGAKAESVVRTAARVSPAIWHHALSWPFTDRCSKTPSSNSQRHAGLWTRRRITFPFALVAAHVSFVLGAAGCVTRK
jgi:hypothetical protein